MGVRCHAVRSLTAGFRGPRLHLAPVWDPQSIAEWRPLRRLARLRSCAEAACACEAKPQTCFLLPKVTAESEGENCHNTQKTLKVYENTKNPGREGEEETQNKSMKVQDFNDSKGSRHIRRPPLTSTLTLEASSWPR